MFDLFLVIIYWIRIIQTLYGKKGAYFNAFSEEINQFPRTITPATVQITDNLSLN